MARVIAVTSGKGGAGKTAVSAGISVSLAARNNKVVLVEMDVGLRGIDLLFGVSNQIRYDFGDFLSGVCGAGDAATPIPDIPGLYYLAAPASLSPGYDMDTMSKRVTALREDFDYIVLDTPAGLGVSIAAAAGVSDDGIIVTTPDPVCIRDGARAAALLEEHGFTGYRLIINRVSRQAFRKSAVRDLDDVMDGVGAPLLGVIPEDSEYRSAMAKGRQPEETGRIRQIYDAIAGRIEGEYVPLILKRL